MSEKRIFDGKGNSCVVDTPNVSELIEMVKDKEYRLTWEVAEEVLNNQLQERGGTIEKALILCLSKVLENQTFMIDILVRMLATMEKKAR